MRETAPVECSDPVLDGSSKRWYGEGDLLTLSSRFLNQRPVARATGLFCFPYLQSGPIQIAALVPAGVCSSPAYYDEVTSTIPVFNSARRQFMNVHVGENDISHVVAADKAMAEALKDGYMIQMFDE